MYCLKVFCCLTYIELSKRLYRIKPLRKNTGRCIRAEVKFSRLILNGSECKWLALPSVDSRHWASWFTGKYLGRSFADSARSWFSFIISACSLRLLKYMSKAYYLFRLKTLKLESWKYFYQEGRAKSVPIREELKRVFRLGRAYREHSYQGGLRWNDTSSRNASKRFWRIYAVSFWLKCTNFIGS